MRKAILIMATVLLGIIGLGFAPAAYAQSSNYSGDIVVETIPDQTVAEKLTEKARTSWPWYVTRASGLVAAGSLVILMLSGIGLVGGYTFKFLEPITAWASHRALGITFGISVLAHVFVLLFDHFAPFNIWHLLIPWLSDFKPVTLFGIHFGSLYLALGILSLYGVVAIVLTSLVWIEKKPYVWKLTHLISYLVMFFVYIHALYLGTDLASGILRWIWIILGIFVGLMVLHRLWRAKTT